MSTEEIIITLNVGGKEFQTSKSTLTKVAGSFFDNLISGKVEAGKSNSFFIDRDGEHFRYILNYLRDGDCLYPESIAYEVEKELKFYKVLPQSQSTSSSNSTQTTVSSPPSSALTSDLIDSEHFEIINKWLGNSKISELLFKASKDGFDATKFHANCDYKGATVSIIKSSCGNVFGGYNSQSWHSENKYYGDDKCFLFTLVNKHGVKPTKYIPNGANTNYVAGIDTYGPTFGSGHDLVISNNCNANKNSLQNFPTTYGDSTRNGKSTFAADYAFLVTDYEVYSVL
ncbi:hypothetical protein PPL_07726 [Heterostelium album PN500]|uniref:Uncharacterized protein n=1 Tax=Heterostelium pallidum (strain ATCC 26659 / Pp 5 / PN500) TaxID=670386 RepID=D3BGS4_HETP5|nr:hypothetical protein PPL_07726 [Heterostelium album PN500]EFA79308.1 hypothetical protein PPL_07726 [Heterostelium album PN500]|eukprot:XP_020431429.1 hypothetical protein PPL_07726 [Heterostelium album PN500]